MLLLRWSSHGAMLTDDDVMVPASLEHRYPASRFDMIFDLSDELVRRGVSVNRLHESERWQKETIHVFSETLTLEDSFKNDLVRQATGTFNTAWTTRKELGWRCSEDLESSTNRMQVVLKNYGDGAASFASLEAAHRKLVKSLRPHHTEVNVDRRLKGAEALWIRRELEFSAGHNFNSARISSSPRTDFMAKYPKGKKSALRRDLLHRAEGHGWPEEAVSIIMASEERELSGLQQRFINAEISGGWAEAVAAALSGDIDETASFSPPPNVA